MVTSVLAGVRATGWYAVSPREPRRPADESPTLTAATSASPIAIPPKPPSNTSASSAACCTSA